VLLEWAEQERKVLLRRYGVKGSALGDGEGRRHWLMKPGFGICKK
jgi:hypothetical protein